MYFDVETQGGTNEPIELSREVGEGKELSLE